MIALLYFILAVLAAPFKSKSRLEAENAVLHHQLIVLQPKTLVRWHRAGFHCYWRWKSRSRGGRPQIETDLRALIRQMSIENPLWGAPRIHGELLKLGFEIAQSSVAKYMVKRCGPPSQGWRTFLRNHAPDIAAWICSLFRPLASICSLASSLCGWIVETSSGSTLQAIR